MLPKAIALAAYVIGLIGAGIFYAYVAGTGIGYWPDREAGRGPLPWLMDTGLLLAFALQHSGMARRSFKDCITRWIPGELERSLYVAASGTVLTLVVFFWQPLSGKPLWQGPIWIFAFSLMATIGIGLCCTWYNHGEFFGIAQAWTGVADLPGPLRTDGPYRYVRHPLMLGLLIAIWCQPIMPRELFLMNAGLTVYVFVAIRLEERDLARTFGADYEQYRKNVPAIIPVRLFVP